jgi:hypothetical protein
MWSDEILSSEGASSLVGYYDASASEKLLPPRRIFENYLQSNWRNIPKDLKVKSRETSATSITYNELIMNKALSAIFQNYFDYTEM